MGPSSQWFCVNDALLSFCMLGSGSGPFLFSTFLFTIVTGCLQNSCV